MELLGAVGGRLTLKRVFKWDIGTHKAPQLSTSVFILPSVLLHPYNLLTRVRDLPWVPRLETDSGFHGRP